MPVWGVCCVDWWRLNLRVLPVNPSKVHPFIRLAWRSVWFTDNDTIPSSGRSRKWDMCLFASYSSVEECHWSLAHWRRRYILEKNTQPTGSVFPTWECSVGWRRLNLLACQRQRRSDREEIIHLRPFIHWCGVTATHAVLCFCSFGASTRKRVRVWWIRIRRKFDRNFKVQPRHARHRRGLTQNARLHNS